MLGKVIKHEFRASGRIMLPAYGAVLALSVLGTIVWRNSSIDGFIGGIIAFLYGASMFCMFIATIVIVFQRFKKSMLSDEGYLSHTLPVSIDTHLIGRILVAACWSLGTIIVCIISVTLVANSNWFMDADVKLFFREFGQMCRDMGIHPALFTVELILVFVMGLLAGVTPCYSALTVSKQFSKFNTLIAVAFFIGSNMILTKILSIPVEAFSNHVYNNREAFYHTYESGFGTITTSTASLIHSSIGIIFVCSLICCAVHYFITRYFLKNKLNLE